MRHEKASPKRSIAGFSQSKASWVWETRGSHHAWHFSDQSRSTGRSRAPSPQSSTETPSVYRERTSSLLGGNSLMNASISKRRDTRRRFPRHPIRLFIVGLPAPSDWLAWIGSPDRRIGRQGRHNAPGDLAKCFAHRRNSWNGCRSRAGCRPEGSSLRCRRLFAISRGWACRPQRNISSNTSRQAIRRASNENSAKPSAIRAGPAGVSPATRPGTEYMAFSSGSGIAPLPRRIRHHRNSAGGNGRRTSQAWRDRTRC